jgi:biopolymer transport protein ExbD
MKIVSPLPHRKGRIEIIPLIDIMFFLLAAFMMVSINMIKVKSLKVNLPTDVPAAQMEKKEDFISISVKEDGTIQVDKDIIANKDALLPKLQALYAVNHEQRFLISADQEARHGDVMRVLGRLRAAGFQKVAFSVKPDGVATPDQAAPIEAPTPTPPSVAPAPGTPGAATIPSAATPSAATPAAPTSAPSAPAVAPAPTATPTPSTAPTPTGQ